MSWKNDSCTAEKDLKTVGDKSYIVCKCSKTGAIAAFEGPAFAKLATGSDGSGGSGSGGGDGVASSEYHGLAIKGLGLVDSCLFPIFAIFKQAFTQPRRGHASCIFIATFYCQAHFTAKRYGWQ